MKMPIEPFEVGSIVTGKRILGYEEKHRECKKTKPNGTVSRWTVIYYDYETECLICGAIQTIGSSAFKKRFIKRSVRCKKCAIKIPAGGSSVVEPPALQVDDLLPPPTISYGAYNNFIHR